ncbi:MAG: hypothetical protein KKA28_12620 [Planctomycetes bacterium]|nr:hypothetical protein [Planctomycetota bacterium]MCG2684112.1 hypothetical protein [Planctomycetales bacterium]
MSLDTLPDRPTTAVLQNTVTDFLAASLPNVKRAVVVKLVPIDQDEGTWEAEAEVWQPNATIESLGMQTRRPVLDRMSYLVRLDRNLQISAYGLKDSVTTSE